MTIPAIAQKKGVTDSVVISRYNQWLKTFQLNELIQAYELKTITSPPVIGNDTVKGSITPVKVLVLKPAAKYTDLQDMATAWNYVSEGLKNKGINLNELMLTKLATYSDLPINNVKVITQADTLGVFLLNIYFDGKIKDDSKINTIMGGELNVNYDFNAPPINSILSNTYNLKRSVGGLNNYLPVFSAHFKQYKHKSGTNVEIQSLNTGGHFLQLKIRNIVGQVTHGNYNEIIELIITMDDDKNGLPKINYMATVLYAGGIFKAPKNESDYDDAATEPDLHAQLKNYNNTLNTLFKQVFHAGL
ncbi:hypothetical protein GCM10023149_23380 [Mucilaginibacter gynuensis]|uniref:Uncharacterized protein n=1 Tax=Mucilaginibacter gynuensis TaxID=1302236 RepID=A0ABP8GEU5_9SPHI